MRLTHEILDAASGNGEVLCRGVLDNLRRELPQGSFTAAEAIDAIPAAGGKWYDAARGLRALELAGFVPKSPWPWWVARLAFRCLPAPLNRWANELSAQNWQQAVEEAKSAWVSADAVAFADAFASARLAADADADAARAASDAAALTAHASRAREEVIAIICAAIDAAPD